MSAEMPWTNDKRLFENDDPAFVAVLEENARNSNISKNGHQLQTFDIQLLDKTTHWGLLSCLTSSQLVSCVCLIHCFCRRLISPWKSATYSCDWGRSTCWSLCQSSYPPVMSCCASEIGSRTVREYLDCFCQKGILILLRTAKSGLRLTCSGYLICCFSESTILRN